MPPYQTAQLTKERENAQLTHVKNGGRFQHYGHHSAKFLAPQGIRPARSGHSAAFETIAWQLTTTKN